MKVESYQLSHFSPLSDMFYPDSIYC